MPERADPKSESPRNGGQEHIIKMCSMNYSNRCTKNATRLDFESSGQESLKKATRSPKFLTVFGRHFKIKGLCEIEKKNWTMSQRANES